MQTSRECLQQHPDGKVPVDLLVLGVTEASHILLNHTGRDGTVLGSVAHPACKLAGLRTGDSCNRTLGTTLRGVKHQGVGCFVQNETTPCVLADRGLHFEQCVAVVKRDCPVATTYKV